MRTSKSTHEYSTRVVALGYLVSVLPAGVTKWPDTGNQEARVKNDLLKVRQV